MDPRRHGARRRTAELSRSQGLILTAVLAVLTAVLLAVFFIRLANRPGGKLHGAFGASTFDVGKAATFAPEIARHGPLLLQDLLGHTRDIFVQHTSNDPARDWYAIEAHPGADRACAVRWFPARPAFEDCHGRQYPPDGHGLARYATTVDRRGHVIVDLNAQVDPDDVQNSTP